MRALRVTLAWLGVQLVPCVGSSWNGKPSGAPSLLAAVLTICKIGGASDGLQRCLMGITMCLLPLLIILHGTNQNIASIGRNGKCCFDTHVFTLV